MFDVCEPLIYNIYQKMGQIEMDIGHRLDLPMLTRMKNNNLNIDFNNTY